MCCSWNYWLIWVLEWKCFLGNVTIMYTVKALQRIYTPSLTLSSLFLLKRLLLKEYWQLWSLQEIAIITMTIIRICIKKSKLATTSILKQVDESNRNSPDLTCSSIVFFIWWHSSYPIQTSTEDLCHQQFVNIV